MSCVLLSMSGSVDATPIPTDNAKAMSASTDVNQEKNENKPKQQQPAARLSSPTTAKAKSESVQESKIHELGRKAKARAAQIRNQRAEVIRLDPSQLSAAQRKPLVTATPILRKRKRQRLQQPILPVSALPSSSVVVLQGLPWGSATVLHVRRFLSGLDVLRIYLPILQYTENMIQNDDGDDDDDDDTSESRGSDSLEGNKYLSRQGCVHVQFASTGIAGLALARDGETFRIPDGSTYGDNDHTTKEREITIRLFELELELLSRQQPQATWIDTHWWRANKSTTFASMAKDTLRALHPAVIPILSHFHNANTSLTQSQRQLRIPGLHKSDFEDFSQVTEQEARASLDRLHALDKALQLTLPLLYVPGENRFASNKCWDEENTILSPSNPITLHADPVVHLTAAARRVLQVRQYTLQRILIREWRLQYL